MAGMIVNLIRACRPKRKSQSALLKLMWQRSRPGSFGAIRRVTLQRKMLKRTPPLWDPFRVRFEADHYSTGDRPLARGEPKRARWQDINGQFDVFPSRPEGEICGVSGGLERLP